MELSMIKFPIIKCRDDDFCHKVLIIGNVITLYSEFNSYDSSIFLISGLKYNSDFMTFPSSR